MVKSHFYIVQKASRVYLLHRHRTVAVFVAVIAFSFHTWVSQVIKKNASNVLQMLI